MKPYQIKVCGNNNVDNFEALSTLALDYVGFIFYEKSKRFVASDEVLKINSNARKVGVFVNETHENILQKTKQYNLEVIQLHGNEDLMYIKTLKKSLPKTMIWKAIGVDENLNFETLAIYKNHIDAFVFDTKTPQYGGSGKHFNWQLLAHYTLDIPFFLSGGIRLEDAEILKKIEHSQLIGFDVNSGFETETGIKNIHLIQQFLEQINP